MRPHPKGSTVGWDGCRGEAHRPAGPSALPARWWRPDREGMNVDHSHATKPVVVAIDGSDASSAALDLAADEAPLRRCALRIVHARDFPPAVKAWPEDILKDAVARAHRRAPSIVIEPRYERATAGLYVARMSDEAAVLFVGSRGLAGIA